MRTAVDIARFTVIGALALASLVLIVILALKKKK